MAQILGKGGTLRAGGRVAATLGEWTYEGLRTDWRVDAELLSSNSVLLASPGPFELRLSFLTTGRRWKPVTASRVNGALVVRGTTPWEQIAR
jgi:hypothetical protein